MYCIYLAICVLYVHLNVLYVLARYQAHNMLFLQHMYCTQTNKEAGCRKYICWTITQ